MKATSILVAVVASLAFTAAIASANPALMKKKHQGYPNSDGNITATGEAALEKSLETAVPKTLREQNISASGGTSDRDQLRHTPDSRVPAVVAPGHVGSQGVSESHIKDATKVNANPDK